ncbi:MAG TPA: hypothetical protein EYQ42_08810 [Thiotrichaceae bacterium]|jgi:hypothetical protein|nr:hypothetical protein [Thiotrichaceae bacterium]HIM08193.1 hypothetical protein [Gammaproteobacteria bacterium]
MSKCDLSIELDRPDQLYKIGDTVRCTVYVSVDKNVTCDALTITNMWKTHGKGNRDKETITEEELFKGEWQAGEYNYSYSFELKEGPLTYHGHYINIDRYIKVRADIPWAIDPKSEIEYIVEKGGLSPEVIPAADKYNNLTANVYSQHKHIKKLQNMIDNPMAIFKYGVIASLVLIAIGSLINYSVFFTNNGFGDPILGFILIAVGIFIGVKMIMKNILFGKVGRVTFEVQPISLRATDETEIRFEFTPNVDLDVNKITFSLVGIESATSGSGTSKHTYTHEFHKTECELSRKGILMRDFPVIERATIEIPEDAPHTFQAMSNRIQWTIQASMDIDKSPDWNREKSIEILI